MKECSKCGETKAAELFPANKKMKDGRLSSCKVCHAAAARAKHADKPEKAREKCRKWAAENKDKNRQRNARYRAVNPAIVKEAQARWMKNNLARMREHNANRRAKTKGGLTKGLITKLYRLQQGKCACCRRPLGSSYHADHIVPLAKNGPHRDSNIQLLRDICNMQKKDRDPIAFMQSRGFLI